MKKNKYIMVKAYLNNNLGDDLFLEILSNRYKEQKIYVFNRCNLPQKFSGNVINSFSSFDRFLSRIDEQFWWQLKTKLKININRKKTPIFRYFEKKEKKIYNSADVNIYITGSGFIETESFWEGTYFDNEKEYYNTNPILLGCNFGPYNTNRYKEEYIKLFKKAKDICFRDTYSKKIFDGLDNVRCESDIVFNYSLGEKLLFDNQVKKKYMLISVVDPCKDIGEKEYIKEIYINFIRNCIKKCIDDGLEIILVGFCKNQKDNIIIDEIIKKMSDENKICVFNYPDVSYQEIMGLFKHATKVIASRYHAMIIAMLYQKEVYTIAYNEKMVHVLQDIDSSVKVILTEQLDSLDVKDFLNDYGYIIPSEKLQEAIKSSDKQFEYLDKIFKLPQ